MIRDKETNVILEFENNKELQDCCNEWKSRLFLDHWTIKAKLVDNIDEDDEELGKNCFSIENNASSIKIRFANDDLRHRIVKFSHELTLVHELLHCKYNWLAPPDTMEGRYFDTKEHGLLEEMAKSLIMTKYNIPFSWFSNF